MIEPRIRVSTAAALGRALLASLALALAACGGGGGTATVSAPPTFNTAPPAGLDATTFPTGWTEKSDVFLNRSVVTAANPLAVDAGVEILRAGGTAVDAAIAVQMVLGLVEPQSSGLGGGAFMLHYRASNRTVETYDGRETAPATATPNLFIVNGQPLPFATAVVGGRSVGTPGAVRMLELAHKDHGRLPWARLFERAIQIAEDGFAISPRLFNSLNADQALRTQQPAATYFYNTDLTPKAVGTVLRNPEYAATLRAIASGGANAFYAGPIAADIVAKVQAHPTNPGLLSVSDMANYQAKKRPPVCGTYRTRYNVCGMGMPSSGGATVVMTLGILESFNVAAMGPQTVDSVHIISDAYRLAYADRGQYMADSDFVNVPLAGLINKDYLRTRSQLLRMDRSIGVPPVGTPPGLSSSTAFGSDATHEGGGTSHLSIVDADGNAVSMTTTVEGAFGSKQMVRGFLLNNQLTDFSFAPNDSQNRPIANRVEAGKRPRSSMAPTIVLNPEGEVEIVIGSPGGAAIIQFVTKSLIGMIDWKLSPQDAIELGNFGAATTATTTLERNSAVQATAIADGLRARGHTVAIADQNSGLHGFLFTGSRNPGLGTGAYRGWVAGADPRREGVSRGD
ncbi:MAG: gamma-glutamyltransferase [Burkholderiaceae bacterium]